jgi:hypothetical protein
VVGTEAGLFGLYVANTSTQHMSNIDILYIYNLDFLIFINGVPFFLRINPLPYGDVVHILIFKI